MARKGFIQQRIDTAINHRNKEGAFDNRHFFLDALKDGAQDYILILQQYAKIPQPHSEFLRNTWYNVDPATGWWPDHQPIEPIIRQGLTTAIEVAIERNLPIDTYWISNGNRVEVMIAASEYQVTHHILTPSIPMDPTDFPNLGKAPIWMVRRKAGSEKPEQERPSSFIEQVIENSGVVIERMKHPAYI